MNPVSIREAKAKFSALVEAAGNGETIRPAPPLGKEGRPRRRPVHGPDRGEAALGAPGRLRLRCHEWRVDQAAFDAVVLSIYRSLALAKSRSNFAV